MGERGGGLPIKSVPGQSVYDLQGRKINAQSSMFNVQLPKGIYIVNGKKVLVK